MFYFVGGFSKYVHAANQTTKNCTRCFEKKIIETGTVMLVSLYVKTLRFFFISFKCKFIHMNIFSNKPDYICLVNAVLPVTNLPENVEGFNLLRK